MIQVEELDWRSFLDRPALPPPSTDVLDALCRESILITGAGGSIGAALARRLAALAPRALLLLDASEGNLYSLDRQLGGCATAGATCPILGSVADRPLLKELFFTHVPRVVFHAAAFKHVPLMETQPLAAIANNIFGTETLVKAASTHGARVVLLSTDKAVEPSSVMGATKRVAEQIVLASGGIVLRLGNVLASRGSVVEVFARQIMQGRPVTVTSRTATRYFLTLDEAVNLLISAAMVTEPSSILAPLLMQTTIVADLARFMIQMLGGGQTRGISFVGLRPGDKENERLWAAGDTTRPSEERGLTFIETAQATSAHLESSLSNLRTALDARDVAASLKHLQTMVPDYTPSPTVQLLAQQHRQLAST